MQEILGKVSREKALKIWPGKFFWPSSPQPIASESARCANSRQISRYICVAILHFQSLTGRNS
jgi:hypothetical protein